MSSNLVGLLNRIHAVNTEIADVANSDLTLSPRRYFPVSKDISFMPIIAPLVPSGQHDATVFGGDELHSVWSIPIWVWVDKFNAGSSPNTAQANTEPVIDHLLSEYWKRPRLELENETVTEYSTESAGAFNCILSDARLNTNSTLQSLTIDGANVAVVQFTLTVETTNDFERI